MGSACARKHHPDSAVKFTLGLQGIPGRLRSGRLSDMSDVTFILESIERGGAKAADELLPLVYGELRRLAAHKMTGDFQRQSRRRP